ncbi:MurR/RpiR family transcriptional regulator [Oleispirillum naphthae]|uniref:MurR/RpiR family transcriptional regulator n=1 Tax=Oleispirillum naphthae TaxID=2838853 RepID=UPI0030825A3D
MSSEKQNLLQRLPLVGAATPSERKLLDYFATQYPHIAFSNLAEISARTGVSKTTVTRFVRRLGYADFHVFIRSLRDEVVQNFDTPGERRTAKAHVPAGHMETTFATGATVLERTLEQADADAFARVLALLADEKRPLYLMSVASGHAILHYFYVLAKYARRNLHMLGGDTSTLSQEIVDAGPDAVLFALAVDRHPMATLTALKHFHQLGCETILLTNRHGSPLLPYARHTLFVHTEGQSRFKSRCSALVMLEALLAGLVESDPEGFDVRYEVMNALTQQLNVFVQK